MICFYYRHTPFIKEMVSSPFIGGSSTLKGVFFGGGVGIKRKGNLI